MSRSRSHVRSRNDATTTTAGHAWWHRIVDGAHSWGAADVTLGHYGLRRYRLTIFPPGISVADRRLLRLCRGWPVGGGVLAILLDMVLGDRIASAETTLLVAALTYVGITAVLFALTADIRPRVKKMTLTILTGAREPDDQRRYEQWEYLVRLLRGADAARDADAISAAQHETLWWQAYDSLEVRARV